MRAYVGGSHGVHHDVVRDTCSGTRGEDAHPGVVPPIAGVHDAVAADHDPLSCGRDAVLPVALREDALHQVAARIGRVTTPPDHDAGAETNGMNFLTHI